MMAMGGLSVAEAIRQGTAPAPALLQHLKPVFAHAAIPSRMSPTPSAVQRKPGVPDVVQCGIAKTRLNRQAAKRTRPSRVTFTGRWTENVFVRGARSYRNDRNRQLLKHVSVQLFHYVRNQLGMLKEQEIPSDAPR